MAAVLLRRLAAVPPAVLGVSIVVFLLLNVLPGDPLAGVLPPNASVQDRAELTERMGLDDPLPVQYVTWLLDALQGDLGWSYPRRRPITELVGEALWNTVVLAGAALLIALVGGVALGLLAALRRGRAADRFISMLSMFGLSVPNFWLAILLIIVFSANLRWLPAGGMQSADGGPGDLLAHLIMPAVATAIVPMCLTARTARAALVEAFGEDFVALLRAKGLSQRQILGHVLRNSASPIMTIAGLQIGYLLGGSVLIESIYSWPGLGQLIFQSIATRDLRLIQASVLVIALTFVVVNLVIDLLQIAVDPRLRRAAS